MKRLQLLTLVLALAVPAAALSQDDEREEVGTEDDRNKDAAGLRDHPGFQRFPGSVLREAHEKEFESFELPTSDAATLHAEGRYFDYTYRYPDKASCTQIVRNYQNAFKKAGLKIYDGKNIPEKAGESGVLAGEVWVTGSGKSKGGGGIHFVVSCDTGAINGEVWGQVVIVEEQAMEQKVEIDAEGMVAALEKNARIALYGIHFETGKADLTPDSAKTLEQIAELLGRRPEWTLRVEGHTDNVGKAPANLDLSKRRAKAVRDWMVAKHKVASARLIAEGFGDTRPVADNNDQAGRARNRRVELVKME